MKKNIGSTDRLIRFVIAGLLIGLTVLTKNWIFGVLAAYPLVTAILQVCPAKEAMQFNPR